MEIELLDVQYIPPLFTISLTLQDGANTQIQSIEIELLDVQDMPPLFTSSVTTIVNENLAPVSMLLSHYTPGR